MKKSVSGEHLSFWKVCYSEQINNYIIYISDMFLIFKTYYGTP